MAEIQMHFQMVKGLPFPTTEGFYKENIERAMNYMPQDGDIIIASYPKTGTTWLRYIVSQVLSKGGPIPSWEGMDQECPYMELVETSALDALKHPRTYTTHIPYNMLKENSKSKCVYIYRRPEDTLVSYYRFLVSLKPQSFDLHDFFELFLEGQVSYGAYFEHLLTYLAHKDLLLVSYEKLLEHREREITRIAKFLGQEYLTSEELTKIVEQTDFGHMKKKITPVFPPRADGKPVDFFRKGEAGDGKKSLTLEQLKRLKEITAEVMKGTSILEEWLEE